MFHFHRQVGTLASSSSLLVLESGFFGAVVLARRCGGAARPLGDACGFALVRSPTHGQPASIDPRTPLQRNAACSIQARTRARNPYASPTRAGPTAPVTLHTK